jgi:hypothetical protein
MKKRATLKSEKPSNWETLPDSLKAIFGQQEWSEVLQRSKDWEAQRQARLQRPADWVEPSISLAQAEADPYCESLAELMRERGIEVMTRSRYFAIEYGDAVPRPWTAELESTLPTLLRDRYMTVPRGLKRMNLAPEDL